MGQDHLEEEENTTLLGLSIDENLNWNLHINKLCDNI